MLSTRSQQGTRVSPREASKPKTPSICCCKDQQSGQEGKEGGKEHEAEEDVLCTKIQRIVGYSYQGDWLYMVFPFQNTGSVMLNFSWEHSSPDSICSKSQSTRKPGRFLQLLGSLVQPSEPLELQRGFRWAFSCPAEQIIDLEYQLHHEQNTSKRFWVHPEAEETQDSSTLN